MTYDVEAVRGRIPALRAGVAHFDGPGGTQTPASVIEAVTAALSNPLSVRGSVAPGEINAETIVREFRRAMADLLGARETGIVSGRSATQLTFDIARVLARSWAPGDEVVVSRLDHDANIRPWTRAAEQAGAVVRWADFDPATGELPVEAVTALLTDRTRLVAVTAASNLIGTRPDIAAIAGPVHDAGALLYVDGVHYTAHVLVDVEALGADFFVCSPYKFFGPHHGVLAASPHLLETLRPDKLAPSTDTVPERFELGTLPYEALAGTRAAVDFLADLAPDGTGDRRTRLRAAYAEITAHETALRAYAETGLSALDGVTRHSRAALRTPTTLLTFEGRAASDAYHFLARSGVHAPAGSFYALEASRHLGLGDTGGLRVGLSPYTDTEDVDRLVTGLAEFLRS
ncbi:cysteine desulfurase-like protein [Streptomyces sp. NBC_01498]|uniref:cysteine desulfurase-like protein n=1 Tax=Streptomyces sp. NBC_01498 TaxID=2975870 RepID=UPI002E7C4A4B|nr:cysteine desulfurase-like protein [Streptomyces sp. NBC_01498]WTL28543.1 cysteine desulfurase-like protein [Streptomyces sp. NBC_01498]